MKPCTYSLSGYGNMITDSVRMDAYTKALQVAVKPGSTVLDIGTGTGIHALLACQFGAKKVYAIEPSDAIQVAKEIAVVNGYGDRIEFIQDISTAITLPEPVDVIVADLRGVLPLFQHHISSLADAFRRFLAPGGILIPQQDRIWATVVEAPTLYQDYVSPWQDDPYGFDFRAARRFVINTWQKARIQPEQFLTAPQHWATLDYGKREELNITADLTWTTTHSGIAHGLCLWFDTTLIDDIGFSNAPDQPEVIYGNAFFPFSQPVEVLAGDQITIRLQANLVGDDYIWSWKTQIQQSIHPDTVKAQFQQSTFFSTPLSSTQLQKQSDRHSPTLNQIGQIDHLILTQMEQSRPLGDIAHLLVTQFPDRFANWKAALTHVGELSQRYSV